MRNVIKNLLNIKNFIYNYAYFLHIFAILILAFLLCLLMRAYAMDNFDYEIVSLSSSSDLPLYYKIFAIFATHQGSLFMLLFCYVIVSFILCIKIKAKAVNIIETYIFSNIINVNFLIILAMSILIFVFNNPFAKNLTQINPNGLNILLQDDKLLIHPLILYISYCIIFASCLFIVNCMLGLNIKISGDVLDNFKYNEVKNNNSSNIDYDNKFYNSNVNLTKYNLLEKILNFLRLGWILHLFAIALGAAWGYSEFSWGGYWANDPVELLSLISLIATTGLYHTIIITIKTSRLARITFIFAYSIIFCIILSFFLIRSGLLISSHAFSLKEANFNNIYIIFVCFFFSLIFLLKNIRDSQDTTSSHKTNGIKFASIIVAAQVLILLFAILFPIFYRQYKNQIITINENFFYYIFNPIVIPIIFLMIFYIKEKKTFHLLKYSIVPTIFFTYLNYAQGVSYMELCYLFLSYTAIIISLILMMQKVSGMLLSHIGFCILIISIIFNKHFEQELIYKGKIGQEAILINKVIEEKITLMNKKTLFNQDALPENNLRAQKSKAEATAKSEAMDQNNFFNIQSCLNLNLSKRDKIKVKILEVAYQDVKNYYSSKAKLLIEINNATIMLAPEIHLYKHQNSVISKSDIFSFLFYDIYAVYQGSTEESKEINQEKNENIEEYKENIQEHKENIQEHKENIQEYKESAYEYTPQGHQDRAIQEYNQGGQNTRSGSQAHISFQSNSNLSININQQNKTAKKEKLQNNLNQISNKNNFTVQNFNVKTSNKIHIINIYYRPMMSFIWISIALIILGALKNFFAKKKNK